MIKLLLKLIFFIFVLKLSACNATEVNANIVFTNEAVCELDLGSSSTQVESLFDKQTIYTENGEGYVYKGLICNKKVMVDVSVFENQIDIISIIDSKFCNNGICIGNRFQDIRLILSNSKLLFSGEEGGTFALKDTQGISYLFSTDSIDISCYIDKEKCKSKINNAKLTSIVITQ